MLLSNYFAELKKDGWKNYEEARFLPLLLFKMTISSLKKIEANLTFTIFQSGRNIMNIQSMKKTFLALKE